MNVIQMKIWACSQESNEGWALNLMVQMRAGKKQIKIILIDKKIFCESNSSD